MSTIIIFHHPCPDGSLAAYLFSKAYPNAEFFEARYDRDPPNIENKDVYIVDFSYKPEPMLEILQKAKSVKVLDHHKTAIELLTSLMEQYPDSFLFDLNRSGAGLAWDYLMENPTQEFRSWLSYLHKFSQLYTPENFVQAQGIMKKLNRFSLVNYVQDRDLWLWREQYSKELNAVIASYPIEFKTWDHLVMQWDQEYYSLIKEGEALLRKDQQIIDQHVKQAREVIIQGYKVPCVNATILVSEIGAALSKNKPFAVIYYDNQHGKNWSLRSDKETNGVDVSLIAQKFGGGGHFYSAACHTKLNQSIID